MLLCPSYGEPLDVWKDQIDLLLAVSDLWNLAKNNEQEKLSKMIDWPDPDKDPPGDFIGFYWEGRRHHIHWDIGEEPGLMDDLRKSRFVRTAYYFVHKELEKAFQRFDVSPATVWSPRKDWYQGRRKKVQSQVTLKVLPQSLMGALWLQFAQAVSGEEDFVPCKVCRKWILIGELDGQRTDASYCTDACRMKMYRNTKAEAWKLHKQGMSIKDIARKLGREPKTVRGWIRKKGR